MDVWLALAVTTPVAMLAGFIWLRSEVKRFTEDNLVGLSYLQRGLHREGKEWFARQLVRYRLLGAMRKLTRYNLALAEFRSGNMREAINLLEQLERSRPLKGIRQAVPGTLSFLYALSGDLGQAEKWYAVSSVRPVIGLTSPQIMQETAIGLRKGNAAAIVSRLDAEWPQLEHSRKGEILRPLRVLRAFAAWQTSNLRAAGTVEMLLAPLRPVRPGEFDYLAVEWPELLAFLTEHQLRS